MNNICNFPYLSTEEFLLACERFASLYHVSDGERRQWTAIKVVTHVAGPSQHAETLQQHGAYLSIRKPVQAVANPTTPSASGANDKSEEDVNIADEVEELDGV